MQEANETKIFKIKKGSFHPLRVHAQVYWYAPILVKSL